MAQFIATFNESLSASSMTGNMINMPATAPASSDNPSNAGTESLKKA